MATLDAALHHIIHLADDYNATLAQVHTNNTMETTNTNELTISNI